MGLGRLLAVDQWPRLGLGLGLGLVLARPGQPDHSADNYSRFALPGVFGHLLLRMLPSDGSGVDVDFDFDDDNAGA